MSGWSNLREFSARLWSSTQPEQLNSFLLPAWSTFGPNLRKMTLMGHPSGIRTLHSPDHHRIRNDIAGAAPLEDVIVPFINGVSATLDVLSPSCWGTSIDFSQCFFKLGVFQSSHQAFSTHPITPTPTLPRNALCLLSFWNTKSNLSSRHLRLDQHRSASPASG